jgi:hypothetical protein
MDMRCTAPHFTLPCMCPRTALPGRAADGKSVSKWTCGKAKADEMVDVNDRELGSEGQTIDSDRPLAISPARISQTQSPTERVRPFGEVRKRPC